MQLFNSIVRQYTPPTCWLEIEAKESPLSRWVRLPMLNQLRFELRFNDPRESEEQQVTIWGNGAELEALHEAVTTYVQQSIEQSPNQLLLAVREPSNNGSRLPMMPNEDNNYHSTAITASKLNSFRSEAGYEQDSETVQQQYPPEEEAPRPSMMLSATPYLRPKSLVAHELVLGPLQTQESGPVILLSASQLFDLATALDDYASDVVTMPNLRAPRQTVRTEYIWAGAAAGGLLAVGLVIIVFNLNHHSAPATVTAEATPSIQPSMPEPTPIAPYASPLPTSPALSTIPSPLASPPPGATALLPTQPGQEPITSTQPGQLPLIQSPPQQPYQIGTQTGQPYQIGTQSGQGAPSRNTKVASGSTNRQTSSATTRDSNRTSQPSKDSSPSRPPLRLLNGNKIPQLGKVPPVTSPSGAPNLQVGQSIGDSNYHVEPAPVIPPTIALGGSPSDNQATPKEGLPSSSAASLGIGNSPTIEQSPNLTANANTDNSLFDRIPQVAEARQFLEKRWQPPQDLKQSSLDYTVIVAGDGTIERIIPLTKAAKDYMDKSGIPKIGEKFVSPPGRIANIRVGLKSDGKVETMLIP